MFDKDNEINRTTTPKDVTVLQLQRLYKNSSRKGNITMHYTHNI